MTDSWGQESELPTPQIKKSGASSKIALIFLMTFSVLSILFIILALIFGRNQTNETSILANDSTQSTPSQTEQLAGEEEQSQISNEDQYLNLLSSQIESFGFTESEALELGYLVCGAFDEGQKASDIKSTIESALTGNPDGVLAARESAIAAVTALCPVHSKYVSDLSVTTTQDSELSNSSACDPNYSGACVPIVPYDFDCPDIGQLVLVVGTDIHKFDRDRDGRACES